MKNTTKSNTWNVDPVHSRVGFAVRHMLISKVRGSFNQFTAAIELDPSDLTRSTVQAKIETASIDTGQEKRDAHLRSGDFFDVEHYPSIEFASRTVRDLGDGVLEVTGDLTIRDVTREVVLTVEETGRGKDPWGNQRIAFEARLALDRREFGLRWNQALETGGVLVGDKVEIEMEVQAVQAAAAMAA